MKKVMPPRNYLQEALEIHAGSKIKPEPGHVRALATAFIALGKKMEGDRLKSVTTISALQAAVDKKKTKSK